MADFDLSPRDETVTIPTAKLGERISVFSDVEYAKTEELAKLFAKKSPAVDSDRASRGTKCSG